MSAVLMFQQPEEANVKDSRAELERHPNSIFGELRGPGGKPWSRKRKWRARDARLALRIRAEHAAFGEGLRDSLEHARTAGTLLNEAKEKMTHGYFGAWIKQQCDLSHRTANNYMLIAREWSRVEANSQHVANSSLGAVVRWLSVCSRARATNAPLTEVVQTVLGPEERSTQAYPTLLRKIETEMALTNRLRGAIAGLTEADGQSAITSLLVLQRRVDDVLTAVQEHVAFLASSTPVASMTTDELRPRSVVELVGT